MKLFSFIVKELTGIRISRQIRDLMKRAEEIERELHRQENLKPNR